MPLRFNVLSVNTNEVLKSKNFARNLKIFILIIKQIYREKIYVFLELKVFSERNIASEFLYFSQAYFCIVPRDGKRARYLGDAGRLRPVQIRVAAR